MAYLTAGKSGGFWRRQAGYVARGGFKLIGFAISVILAAGIVVWGNDVVSQDGTRNPGDQTIKRNVENTAGRSRRSGR